MLESLLRKSGLLQRLSHPWVAAQVSILQMRLRGAGTGSQVIPRCVCPMPDAQVGKTSWVPWQMVLGPTTPTESHFVHRWMPNHNCKKRRQKGGMSNATMILTSLLKTLFFYSYLKLLANVYSRAKSKQLLIYKKIFLFLKKNLIQKHHLECFRPIQ